jgi:preprotein translocase SecF subunit
VFDIIGKRNWFFLFSGIVVVPGLIFILLTPLTGGAVGLKFSVDYTGGTVWEIQFNNPNANTSEVSRVLVANGVTDAEVSEDSAHYFTVRTKQTNLLPAPTAIIAPTLSPTGTPGPSATAAATATATPTASPTAAPTPSPTAAAGPTSSSSASASGSAAATAAATASPTAAPSPTVSPSPTASPSPIVTPVPTGYDAFAAKGCDRHIPTQGPLVKIAAALQADPALGPISCTREETTVGPIISSELIQQAVLLILLGSLGILAWVGIRFHSIKFGATALAALAHDIIVVVGIFAILGTVFGVQIDALFVTAMLTVIGFSVHDTIVVYDRIRENKARHAGEPFDQIVNHSVLQTFGRSINTSFTVVLTLMALLLFAGASIHYFVLALLIGIISGTYSSIFNASPLLVVWQLWEDRRRAEQIALARGGRRPNG